MTAAAAEVLLVGDAAKGGLTDFFAEGLTELGIPHGVRDAYQFDRPRVHSLTRRIGARVFGLERLLRTRRIAEAIEADLQDHAPRIVLVVKGVFLRAATLRRWKTLWPRRLWCHFHSDDPFGNPEARSRNFDECIALYDHHFFPRRVNVAEAVGAGAVRASWLPFGFSRRTHLREPSAPDGRSSEVLFVGTFDVDRLGALVAVAEAGFPLRIWGNGWRIGSLPPVLRPCLVGREVSGNDYASLVQRSFATLGLLRKANRDLSTMRSFEIPAAGGLLVAERTAEHDLAFGNGCGYSDFSTPTELIHRLAFLREDNQRAETIRAKGFARVMKHSYTERMREALNVLELARS